MTSYILQKIPNLEQRLQQYISNERNNSDGVRVQGELTSDDLQQAAPDKGYGET